MEKIWKPIPGYEGLYEASNFGDIKSLGNNATRKEKILKVTKHVSGYYQVGLTKNGKQKMFKVHQLVAMAFLGHQPNGYEIVINHIDHNTLNNNVDNLELVNNRYNATEWRADIGVDWFKMTKKWRSRIYINGEHIHLGYFTDKQEALDAYQKALSELN